MGKYAKPHWDGNAGQWAQLIGYTTNKHGKRVRKRFYFGAEEKGAIHTSITQQLAWKTIVDATRPVWESATPSAPATPSKLKISQAVTQFLARKKAQVGLAGGKGIKPSTYNGLETTLNLAIGRDSIDTSKQLSALTKSDLESFVQKWMRLPDGISTRTAVNYATSFKVFLDWCHDEGLLTKPPGTDSLFSFRATKTPNVQKVSTDTLKQLLAEAAKTPKTLLYIMLALNCGHYQSDIADLRHSELIEVDGEHYIVRQRTKMKGADDSTDNHRRQGMVTTYLFPETYKLLMQFTQEKGDHMLRNTMGGLLWEENIGKTRRDAISPAYERVCKAASVSLSFRQLRKVGWQAMKRIGGTDDLARRWAGQKAHGISQFYAHDDYEDVTKALKQWHTELMKAEILPQLP